MLYIVATPIGNLSDMTFRAIDTLKSVDYVFAEDTRQTKKLLNAYDIDVITYIYNEHNKNHQVPNIIKLLLEEKNIALVTDAGMPCLSDPGYQVVDAAYKNNIKVTAIPGCSALPTAVALSGVYLKRFVFEGFLPKKKGRQTLFTKLQSEERSIILYESPFRVVKTLKDVSKYLGNRYVIITRELTKIYEEIIRDSTENLIKKYDGLRIKGEIVMIITNELIGECNGNDEN